MRKAEAPPPPEERPFDFLPEAEPMAVQDIRDALVIREGDTFLLTDTAGQVVRNNRNGHGLYRHDTRYLSGYELAFSNARPIVLLSTAALGYAAEQVMTNPAMLDAEGRRLAMGSLQIRRLRVMDSVLEETIEVVNHNTFAVDVEITLRFAADFADIFEVRGYEPERRGEREPTQWQDGALWMRYKGADGHTRETVISVSPQPDTALTDEDVGFLTFRLALQSQESRTLAVVIGLDGRLEAAAGAARFVKLEKRYQEWRDTSTRVRSDNAFFDEVIARSLDDLRMLWNEGPRGSCYPGAGTPWYDTLFGRDSCIVGLQTLAFRPEIARECLTALARHQGAKFDAWRDEEPGKIPHELRQGELTRTGELPFSPYYGSIDSTPLFLMLASEYYRWTADVECMRELAPHLEAALHWLETYGDTNGDGYIEYEKRSVKGLVNQGWKDSVDSMVHSDGTLMPSPITVVEVQAYAYAAQRGVAEVYRAIGREAEAQELDKRADALRERFNRDFWVESEGCYALGIDGSGRQSAAVTSNPGHALWCGIATPEQAERTAKRLFCGDMFSGYGVRTLTSESPRFNPQGYHLGTVWPHDNSLLAAGLKRYGLTGELSVLASALFRAARTFPYQRLPELFGGTEVTTYQAPVPYPVACRPQAWAAGSFPLITQAMLGLAPDARSQTLYVVEPVLPPFLNRVTLEGICVGPGRAGLLYERDGGRTRVTPTDLSGGLKVEMVSRWP